MARIALFKDSDNRIDAFLSSTLSSVLTWRVSISWRLATFLDVSFANRVSLDEKRIRRMQRYVVGVVVGGEGYNVGALKVSPRGCQANKPGKGEALVANCVLTTRRHKARVLIDSLLVYLSLSHVHSALESRLPKLNGVSLTESTLSD